MCEPSTAQRTLDEVPEAIRHLRAGRARGKVVIVV
jgi:D-arabinose 1-dehydrogenase-like Zn-dependent alcohol dehydrogenase